MTENVCIYGPSHGRKYKDEIALLQAGDLDNTTKRLIQEWHDHLFAKGSGELRVVKLGTQIRRIAADMKKPLGDVTKKDVTALLASYRQSEGWSDATKADYRRALKQFYAWYKDDDPRVLRNELEARQFYEYLRKDVSVAAKDREIAPESIITQPELEVLLEKGASTVKERAFLSLLHEGGFRVAEFLNIRLKDLNFKHNRFLVTVSGKTGTRTVPLCWSMGYVTSWLGVHPERNNPDAFLWVVENQNPNLRGAPIKYGGGQKLINRCWNRAFPPKKKKHNWHWFRHSRASLNAPDMTEAILCQFFGWRIGSRVVRKYVHLNKEQLERAVLNMNNIVTDEQKAEQTAQCSCGTVNIATARYCARCGRPMSVTIMIEDDKQKDAAIDEAFKLLADIMSDPVKRAAFEKFKANNGGR